MDMANGTPDGRLIDGGQTFKAGGYTPNGTDWHRQRYTERPHGTLRNGTGTEMDGTVAHATLTETDGTLAL